MTRLERLGPVTQVHLDVGRPLIASVTTAPPTKWRCTPGLGYHRPQSNRHSPGVSSAMPARLLHVDLDAFFVEVCRQYYPELRDIELLVVGGRRDQRGVVQSASHAARRFGIHAGMPIAEAVRLCPQATFFQGSFVHYRDASHAVRALLEDFSPTVVMASLDEAYLDFAGTERQHPTSLLPVAEQVRDMVKQRTGLDASIGIGPNRMIAKMASDYAKPRGLMEVRAGWEKGFLRWASSLCPSRRGAQDGSALGRAGTGERAPDSGDDGARAGTVHRSRGPIAQASGQWPGRDGAPAGPATQIREPGDHVLPRPAGP